MMGCVQAVLGNKKFVVQFENFQKREMSASSLSYVCEKEGVVKDVDKTISGLSKIEQVELLTINWNTVCEGDGTFLKGIILSMFYRLCFLGDISEYC